MKHPIALLMLSFFATPVFADDKDDAYQYCQNTLNMVGHYSDGDTIAEMNKALEQVNKAIGSSSSDPRWKLVERVRLDIAALKLKKTAFDARQLIQREMYGGQLIDSADLKAYEDAVAAFVKGASPDLKAAAEAEAKELAELKAKSKARAEGKAEEEAKAKHSKQVQAAAEEEAAKRSQKAEVGHRANNALDEARRSTRDTNEVPSDKMSALLTAANDLDAIQPHSGEGYRADYRGFQRLALWSQADPAAQKAIADALSADLVAKGTIQGKAFSVTFPVQAEHCYLVVTKFSRFSGTETSEGLTLTAKGSSSGIQPFHYESSDGGQKQAGLCATQVGQVTVKTKLDFPGTQNGLRYAVLGWPRAQLPADVVRQMELGPFDPCDAAQWKTFWTHPIPGTLVYLDKEPHLVSVASSDSFDVFDLSTGKDRYDSAKLTSQSPKAAAFRTHFIREPVRRPGEPITVVSGQANEYSCAATEASTAADAVALFKCQKAVQAKYKKEYDQVDRIREQASRMGGIAPKAESMRSKLDEDSAADEKRKCGPIQTKITNAMEKVFNEVVDAYADHPQQDPIDRLLLK